MKIRHFIIIGLTVHVVQEYCYPNSGVRTPMGVVLTYKVGKAIDLPTGLTTKAIKGTIECKFLRWRETIYTSS